jgi:hypothetical protein
MSKMTSAAVALLAIGLYPTGAFATQDLSGFSGLIDGNFTYSRDTRNAVGSAIDTDQYTAHGVLLYTFDNPGFGFQVEGQNNFYFGIKHNAADLWSAGGTAFFRDDKGTIGLSGSYFAADAPAAPFFPGKKSIESYGFFGEYYPFRSLTLTVKGGGTSGPVGLASYFGGGGLTWYEYPDLAFHTEINFTSFTSGDDWTDYKAGIEYLPFSAMPVSVEFGYDHAIVAKVGYTSAFFASLKFHFGQGRSLVDYDRTGPVQYTGNATPGSNLKF